MPEEVVTRMDDVTTGNLKTTDPIAQVLCDLSPAGTTLRPTKSYIGLVAPQSGYIGANIFQNFVWFYLNEELRQALEGAGFKPERWKGSSAKRRDKNKFRLRKLSVEDVANNSAIFARALQYSINTRDGFGNRTKK